MTFQSPSGVYMRVEDPRTKRWRRTPVTSVPARLTVALPRCTYANTVGHGFHGHLSHVDPVGSACGILGWWADGTVSVALPHGGFGMLGCADVAVTSWPDYAAHLALAWAGLPRASRLAEWAAEAARWRVTAVAQFAGRKSGGQQ
jgi:hypothetical protein